MLEIVERFITLSGEAPNPGAPILLIRFTGCNMACTYCDTLYKDEVNETVSVKELEAIIMQETTRYSGLSVLFTGGEPLWKERTEALLTIARALPMIHFYVETNGSCRIPDTELPTIHFVTDIKTPSSGCCGSFIEENLARLKPERDCVKFVTAHDDTSWVAERVRAIHAKYPLLPLYISPQWDSMTPAECAAFIVDNKLPASLSLQLHKVIWGEKRGV